jgi:hypothetical protein
MSGPRGARCERRGGRLLRAVLSAPPAAKLTVTPHVCSHLEKLRKRYAEDQKFRQKKIAYASAYQKAHYEEISARRRRRRESDPAYRQKLVDATQAYYQAHKKQLTEQLRRRRQTDPEHRDKVRARERKASRARDAMTRRKHRLRCVYGISLEEYDAMLDRQGGVCAICKKKPDEGKVLFVDHCHVTGMCAGSSATNATWYWHSATTTPTSCALPSPICRPHVIATGRKRARPGIPAIGVWHAWICVADDSAPTREC